MRRKILKWLLVGAALFLGAPAYGQQVNLYCNLGTGGLNPWQPCSAINPLAVSATITPSGTQNVNLTQILSAAPSLTNPLWVFPATGATFPVSATNFSTNIAQWAGTTAAAGSGVMTAGTPRVALATDSPGLIATGTFGVPSNTQVVSTQTNDPCTANTKSSAAINVTSATTTSLVAVSGSTTVYVCGFSMTVAPSITSADTALFEYGTGAACTSPVALTGTYGNGNVALTGVVPVTYGSGIATIFKSAASNGVCILTAGTTVSVQGVLTYVQQ